MKFLRISHQAAIVLERSRVLHLIVTFGVIVITLPVFLSAIFLAIICQHRPIFFSQLRVGQNYKVFVIYKLRSMSVVKRNQGSNVSRLGLWLRKTCLDEIPSFFNVLIGDLYWVGPRPLLLRDVSILSVLCPERFKVRPGLTGITQVAGGNLLSWRRRLSLDASYTMRCSFSWQLAIIALTLAEILHRRNSLFTSQSVSTSLTFELES